MKSLFALFAAALVIATATTSHAGCAQSDKSGRGKTLEPRAHVAAVTKTVKTTR